MLARKDKKHIADAYMVTNDQQDWQIIKVLSDEVDTEYPYRLANRNCRNWVQIRFNDIKVELAKQGVRPSLPPARPEAWWIWGDYGRAGTGTPHGNLPLR